MSGTFNVTTSNTHIVGSVYWEERNVNNNANTSDVYVELRFWRNNTGYTSSGTDYFYVDVNGSRVAANVSYSITYNSNTLFVSGTVSNIAHNADGTKTVTIAWGGGGGSGGVFTVNAGSSSAGLTTIPRASTATSTPNFTVGTQNLPITLAINDASFHHTLELFVQHTDGLYYGSIGTRTGITSSSYTWVFTQAEITTMYQNMGMYETRDVILRVWTYDANNNQVGNYQDANPHGTATAIATSTITLDTDNSFNIPASPYTIPYLINNFPTATTGNFTFDVTLTLGSFTKTITGLTAQSGNLTLTATDVTNMYAATPNSNTLSGTARLRTSYGGQYTEDGNPVSDVTNITAVVTNSNPTFTTAQYNDTNTTVTAVTGNDQYIVQNKSTLVAKILNANKAVGVNSATIAKYIATFNGVSIEVDPTFPTDITFSFGAVNVSVGMNLTITAYDSRGNSTAVVLPVNVVPWSPPVITATAVRDNGFLDNTVLSLSGSISRLTVAGVDKNSLVSSGVTYQYRVVGGTYNAATVFTGQTITMPNYSATAVNLTLANTSAWEIQVQVTDKLGNTTVTLSVGKGTPIMHIDGGFSKVGIGQFPSSSGHALQVTGGIDADNVYVGGKTFNYQEQSASLPATAGWYRIAQTASGVANNLGTFEIQSAESSHHSMTILQAGIDYSINGGKAQLNQLLHTNYGAIASSAITQARIVYNSSTYTGNQFYLEVYSTNATAFTMTVKLVSGTGWTLIAPNTAGSIPVGTGWTSMPINLQSGGMVTSGQVFDKGGTNVSPTGAITMFGGATAPTGWLIADGSQVSRTTYADLFAVIGTNFGAGDGSSTFNLPNFAGRMAIGVYGADTDFNAVGKTGGEKNHTLTTSEMPAHTHNIVEDLNSRLVGRYGGADSGSNGYTYQGAGRQSTFTTDSQGGGAAHNNMPPYSVVNFIIKT